MLVIDEYLAVDVTLGDWPAGLPDDETLLLPASRHFRLLQIIDPRPLLDITIEVAGPAT